MRNGGTFVSLTSDMNTYSADYEATSLLQWDSTSTELKHRIVDVAVEWRPFNFQRRYGRLSSWTVVGQRQVQRLVCVTGKQ